ncbi:unnamed protein product [Gongylonema pulchrum]|uniref:PHR domain-containing protein n=1 Tax=Gongylonema pulchrum TaxID=637853 RepID=A0A183DSL0_9BILA|nr:unnamed protein product [Gongylonema pulchrum]
MVVTMILEFACFKSKDVQDINPDYFNGFVFPTSLCNRPDVVVRVAVLPYQAFRSAQIATELSKTAVVSFDIEPVLAPQKLEWRKRDRLQHERTVWEKAGVPVEGGIVINGNGDPRPLLWWARWMISMCHFLPPFDSASYYPSESKWGDNATVEIGVVLVGGTGVSVFHQIEDEEFRDFGFFRLKVTVCINYSDAF